jgi:hypothetical protein
MKERKRKALLIVDTYNLVRDSARKQLGPKLKLGVPEFFWMLIYLFDIFLMMINKTKKNKNTPLEYT